MPLIDITGKRFGRLIVLSYSGSTGRKPRWLCRCDCGKELSMRGDLLKSGNSRSCGCLAVDSATRHGHNRSDGPSATYITWQAMIARCTKPTHMRYPTYGGVGISVCQRWRTFEHFLEDMGERQAGHSIDRINTAGNYEPGNCRWATAKAQSLNRRSNRILTVDGEQKSVSEWASIHGLPRTVVQDRLRLGWTARNAVLTPYRPR